MSIGITAAQSPRVPEENFPGIKEQTITLIRIQGDDIQSDYNVRGKRAMLKNNPDEATYLAVWHGEYRSEVFSVPRGLLKRWTKDIG